MEVAVEGDDVDDFDDAKMDANDDDDDDEASTVGADDDDDGDEKSSSLVLLLLLLLLLPFKKLYEVCLSAPAELKAAFSTLKTPA
jgi:hypothetical protein